MDFLEAQHEISEMRLQVQNRQTLYVLDKWNVLIVELQAMQLSGNELRSVQLELAHHIAKMKLDLTRPTIKASLNSFLSFLDASFSIKSGNKLLTFGLMVGVLLGFVTNLGMWTGILIGFSAGCLGVLYVKYNYRTIKTNVEDLW
jgi:hypothetical protein